MMEVNLFDTNFYHSKDSLGEFSSACLYTPTKLRYLDKLMEYDGVTLFTDHFIFDPIVDQVKSKFKMAWLLEPRVFSDYYDNIIEIEDKFDFILTFDSQLLNRSKKYAKYIFGQSRILDIDAKIYEKCKEMSMIASHKTMSIGHRLRHEIINKYSNIHPFDVWGSGYRSFSDKLVALKDYKYSICIMNSSANNYFTEVVMDCFRVGTVPIFWGGPNIDEYFDGRGIIKFENLDELDKILKFLQNNPEFNLPVEAIVNNFEIVKQYVNTDDNIADILKKIC